jgi:hypothetical protein
MVDSSPASVGPSSTINGIRPPRLASTCSARVGLIDPLAFADGAASGLPVACNSARIARCAGTRIAMVSSPAITSDAIPASGRNGTTRVKGPGQNASANARAAASKVAIFSAATRSGTWTINGLKLGRPLAA